ncbi:hypothetical protein TREMEDRAFT_37146 [Tremella mesenterica DSM 1558]|uniref:uncharacterized protein n=1 Tax=Tremella mesenterica (strain ATCC 24925 / CBS 8224 / DSM 1558 / NBRC 9311 / NRRL Y-6157 / RJB 2259-6 / UBC 559-6) TaxID=578456 RepID=UPI0003F48BDF|nr:uncharacterized protein TREMEDRAFT_37146 [Tremella mesenterica DSM 1558]EIW73102.1 hypothetical protein TREMEDRAFT_37146 [Tremella mesenterica DSM 1558]
MASRPTARRTPPPSIGQDKWDAELARTDISKNDLNALIYDYLVIEGFSDAAVEFARETGLPSEVDEASIRERMEIREAVEEGRVEEAVKRVNELDPEILDNNPPLLFHLHLLRLIEYIREEQIDKALEFATQELAPRGAQHPEFLDDLERTMALLAFPDLAKYADDATSSSQPPPPPETLALFQDPAFTPIIQLMRRSQRVKIAKELNAAILESNGQGMETKLSGLVRLMAWGEEKLETSGMALPNIEKYRGRKWAEAVLSE